MTVELFKKAMNLLAEKEAYAQKCDDYYEAHPFDEEAEEAFDGAYEEEYNAFLWAVDILTHLIKIDEKIAATMIRSKREKINELITRMA